MVVTVPGARGFYVHCGVIRGTRFIGITCPIPTNHLVSCWTSKDIAVFHEWDTGNNVDVQVFDYQALKQKLPSRVTVNLVSPRTLCGEEPSA